MKEKDAQQPVLEPKLGLLGATAISVGATIGGGVFVVIGIAAGLAGSALIISILMAATVSLLTTSSFIQLTKWLPKEGSIYEYTYQLISPFAGFLTGWLWILSNTFAGAAVSLGFAYYLNALFPFLPSSLVSAAMCILFSAFNFLGIRQSAFLNNALVAAKLLVLAFFCILALPHLNLTNYLPFAPFSAGVFYGASYVFFAYGGFARVSVIAEEVKDARRNVPRAILLSLIISTIFYVLVSLTAVGLVGSSRLSSSDSPLADAIGSTGNPIAAQIVSVGGILATASVLLTSIMGVSRMAYAMARRKDLPRILSTLDVRRNTPYYSIWISGISMALLVLFVDLTRVVAISNFALLFYYTLTNIAAIRLRNQRPWLRVVSAMGAATCLVLMIFILFVSPQAWIAGLAALAVGGSYCFLKARFDEKRSGRNR